MSCEISANKAFAWAKSWHIDIKINFADHKINFTIIRKSKKLMNLFYDLVMVRSSCCTFEPHRCLDYARHDSYNYKQICHPS